MRIGETEIRERVCVLLWEAAAGICPQAMRDVVGRSDFYDEGSVCGLLFNLGEYPGAVFDDRSGQRVYGAVFHLAEDSQVFEVLDRYEGYEPGGLTPGACSFTSVITSTSRLGAAVKCWVYEYNGSPQDASIIAGGRYQGPG